MDVNKLNRDFYLKTQEYFNRSRQQPWLGWRKLLPFLPAGRLSVLDLGCGNGRFGVWLAKHRPLIYTGLDANSYLLDKARLALPIGKFIKADILKPLPVRDSFDLIAVLGVIHHLSPVTAANLIRQAGALLSPGGILFLSIWEFKPTKGKSLGHNDYLLPWKLGVTAQRFCHLYTDTEIANLVQAFKLELIADYHADTSNRYLILIK